MINNLFDNKFLYIKHSIDNNPQQNDFSMHAHADYELLYFLSGDITYIVEGNIYKPNPHDILIFDIAETHKVIVNSNKPYERTVIQMDKNIFSFIDPKYKLFSAFSNKKLGENNIIHPSDFEDDLWKKSLSRLIKYNGNHNYKAIGFLLTLLNEINDNKIKHNDTIDNTSIHSKIVKFVNEHITEEITTDKIAKKFFISRTALYHIFKEATGTGVHNYINVKRLVMAQNLLRYGEKPTNVFEKCGFKDYSTFYRAYKTHFNISPKDYSKKF